MFGKLEDKALAVLDRTIGFDHDDVAIDGSLHKSPDAVEATGLHHSIAMLHLDRGYDHLETRTELAERC